MQHASPTSRARLRQHSQALPGAEGMGGVLPRNLLRSTLEALQEGPATPAKAAGANKCLAGPATPEQMPACGPVVSSPCTPPRRTSLRRIAKVNLLCLACTW